MREWAFDARATQINKDCTVGDRVNVGYISDSNPHNYQEAMIVWFHPYWHYPNGNAELREERYQVRVRFDDGTETDW